jgi:hypothetical protein
VIRSALSTSPLSGQSQKMSPQDMTTQPRQREFNPYTENGGTILAIAGADFSLIAGDTRQSEGYSIQTRYAPKVFRLSVRVFFVHSRLSTSRTFYQDRQGGIGRQWFRGRCQRVREKGQATTRGTNFVIPRTHPHPSLAFSGTVTLMQRTCLFAPSPD